MKFLDSVTAATLSYCCSKVHLRVCSHSRLHGYSYFLSLDTYVYVIFQRYDEGRLHVCSPRQQEHRSGSVRGHPGLTSRLRTQIPSPPRPSSMTGMTASQSSHCAMLQRKRCSNSSKSSAAVSKSGCTGWKGYIISKREGSA